MRGIAVPQRVHLADGDDNGQLLFDLDAGEFQDVPVPGASDAEEEFEGLLSDVDGAAFPLLAIDEVQQIVSLLIFAGILWGMSQKLTELAHGPAISLLSAGALAIKLEVLKESLGGRAGGVKVPRHRLAPWSEASVSGHLKGDAKDCAGSQAATMIRSPKK